jgi:hypothetical protein
MAAEREPTPAPRKKRPEKNQSGDWAAVVRTVPSNTTSPPAKRAQRRLRASQASVEETEVSAEPFSRNAKRRTAVQQRSDPASESQQRNNPSFELGVGVDLDEAAIRGESGHDEDLGESSLLVAYGHGRGSDLRSHSQQTYNLP